MSRLILLISVLALPNYGIAQDSEPVNKGTITISKKSKQTEVAKISEYKDTIRTTSDNDFFGVTLRNVAQFASRAGVYTEQYDHVASFTCSIPVAGKYSTYTSSSDRLTPAMIQQISGLGKSGSKVVFTQIQTELGDGKKIKLPGFTVVMN